MLEYLHARRVERGLKHDHEDDHEPVLDSMIAGFAGGLAYATLVCDALVCSQMPSSEPTVMPLSVPRSQFTVFEGAPCMLGTPMHAWYSHACLNGRRSVLPYRLQPPVGSLCFSLPFGAFGGARRGVRVPLSGNILTFSPSHAFIPF